MSNVEKIANNGKIKAIIVRSSLPFEGYNFVSDNSDELQMGVNHYKKGVVARPHFHPSLPRQVVQTSEFLHIDSGSAKLRLYDDNQQPIYDTDLHAGDSVMILSGGHAIKFYEDTRIVEVKQGPYYGAEKDKTFFKDESF